MKINGKHYDYKSQSITELLKELNLNPNKVVVELNGDIIDLNDDPMVETESELEIVQFVGGG